MHKERGGYTASFFGTTLMLVSFFLPFCFPPLSAPLVRAFFQLCWRIGMISMIISIPSHPSYPCSYFSLPAVFGAETAKNAGL
ncbi:hypothetical protein GGQ77_002618 [Geobacillus thermodenitrificans]|nr:hypothetical protein [Geobacillus thermodenitrificans]